MADDRVFPDEFVPNIQGANKTSYSQWKQSNPAEAVKWEQFRDAAIAHKKGEPAVPVPALQTKYGKALVAAGKLHMSVTDIGSAPGPVIPPPPTGVPIPANGIISAAGTYSGNHTGQVNIQTTGAVILDTCTLTQNSSSAPLVITSSNANLTVRHCTIVGLGQDQEPRWLQANGIRNCLVESNDIYDTRGINFGECQSGATIRLTKNYHHNVRGAGGPGDTGVVGNFVQFQVVTLAASIEVDWNQVINIQNQSWVEDIISCYFTSKMYAHDNYFQHQSKPGNISGSSQNSITLEGDARINNCRVEYNQVVDAFGIAIFYTALSGTPHDNILLGNRIIADRLLPNGVIKANGWGSPLAIKSGVGPNNHAHNNVVGYVSYDGSRQTLASNLPGASEGAAAEAANNTYLPDPITAAMEATEWTTWQSKLAAAGITVGA